MLSLVNIINPFKNSAWYRDFRKRLRSGTIAPPDIPSIVENYKEPLRKFEVGFGYIGAITLSKDRTKIQCHYCGYFYENLSQHVKSHGITVSQYKENTGLMSKTALIGEKLRLRRMMTFQNLTPEQRKNFIESGRKHASPMQNLTGKNGSHSPEWQNLRGSCPDQLLEKVREVAKKVNRTPRVRDFKKFYPGYVNAIYITFGSWQGAIKASKLEPYDPLKREVRISSDSLLEHLRRFYEINGRTASWSDMRRGLLPNDETYRQRFGTLNEARKRAGVPLLLMEGRRWVEEKV